MGSQGSLPHPRVAFRVYPNFTLKLFTLSTDGRQRKPFKKNLASRCDRILRYMGLIYLLCQYSTALGRAPKFFQLTLAPNLHFSVQYKIDI
jgi:hypothetical protein